MGFLDFIPLPADQARLMFGIVICIPLSYVLKFLTNKYISILYSSIIAFALQFFILGQQCYFLWMQQLLVYIIIKFGPRRRIGLFVTIQSFTYLTAIHLRRYFLDNGLEVDITAILMMSTCKFIGFAFSYQDGEKSESELGYPEEMERRVIDFPSFFIYLGYVQFLPGSLIGPIFEYSDYINYIDRKKNYENIPGTVLATLKEMGRALIALVIYMVVSQFYRVNYFYTHQFINQNFFLQSLNLIITIFGIRFKYYGCWILSNAAIKASGISYQKIKNQAGVYIDTFQRIEVARIMQVEFRVSMKTKIDNWNMSTQVFLRRYVYQRLYVQKLVDKKDKKKLQQRAQTYTILLSAIWHGIYPSYVISFVHWMLYLQITQQIYRIYRQRQNLAKMYDNSYILQILAQLVCNFFFAYYGLFFCLYRIRNIWDFATLNYGIPNILIYVGYYLIVVRRLGQKREEKPKAKTN